MHLPYKRSSPTTISEDRQNNLSTSNSLQHMLKRMKWPTITGILRTISGIYPKLSSTRLEKFINSSQNAPIPANTCTPTWRLSRRSTKVPRSRAIKSPWTCPLSTSDNPATRNWMEFTARKEQLKVTWDHIKLQMSKNKEFCLWLAALPTIIIRQKAK